MRLCLCLPYLSQYGLFILCCGEVVHLVFRYFLEENNPFATVNLVCLCEEKRSESSYTAILQKSLTLSSFKIEVIYSPQEGNYMKIYIFFTIYN